MTAYYNEFDPYAAQWLRNLIELGVVAPGIVDTRSIEEVQPDDLEGFTQCHFFAGIGGWSYALRLAGWPDDRPVWTGSCPCQPFSAAGKRQGTADERHLWPQFRRLIEQRRPPVVFGEQVASPAGRGWLAGVRTDLEALGYEVGAADLCAAGVGAPHIRQRLWWVGMGDADGVRGWRDGRAVSGEEAKSGRNRVVDWGVADGAELAGAGGGMDDAVSSGLEGHSGDEHYRSQPGRYGPHQDGPVAKTGCGNPWSDTVWIPCEIGKDGRTKFRRIEPGIEPLVDGLSAGMGSSGPGEDSPFRTVRDPETGRSLGQEPWRIGMLRGYGNAIVPQVAAAFVESYLQAADDLRR